MDRVKLMKNKGYTIPELIVVLVVVGVFSIIAINKASYAFVDTNEVSEQTEEKILVKSSISYGNSIKDTLKVEREKFISASDLVDAGYLMDDDHYKTFKIKLIYQEETDTVSVEVIK